MTATEAIPTVVQGELGIEFSEPSSAREARGADEAHGAGTLLATVATTVDTTSGADTEANARPIFEYVDEPGASVSDEHLVVNDVTAPIVEPGAEAAALTGDEPHAPSVGLTTAELELPPPAPPTPEERLYIAARDATHRGDLGEARRAYTQLLQIAPTHVRGHNNLALLIAEQGNTEGALASFQRALDLDPENPTLLANRAAVLSLAHRYEAAEADLKKALRLQPEHVESLVQYAVVRSRRGRWREALEPLRQAIALDPTHATGWYHLGEAANQSEQLTESVEAFRRAIALVPGMWRAHKGLGNVLDRMGRVQEAATAHRAARAMQAASRVARP